MNERDKDNDTQRQALLVVAAADAPGALLLDQWAGVLAGIGSAADSAAGATIFADYRARRRPSSIDRQDQDLALFAQFCAQAAAAGGVALPQPDHFACLLAQEPRAWEAVTWGQVAAFLRWLGAAGYAVASINHALSTLKVYAALAAQVGALAADQAQHIRAVRAYSYSEGRNLDLGRDVTRLGAKKAQVTPLTPEQAQYLKRRQPNTPQGWRDAALMALLLDHGLRCSEVAGLLIEQFALGEDAFTATFTFDRPKVSKVQTHRLTPDSLVILRRYLAERRAVDPTDRGALLCASRKDGQLITVGMSVRAINKRVGALGRAVGSATLSPHDCRHYWATMAVRAGTDIKSLQDAGGWASPHMPLRYAQSAEIANQGVKLEP